MIFDYYDYSICLVRVAHSRLIPICNAFFIQRGHRRSLPIIGEESDDGRRIKRALYIGIKRLWSSSLSEINPGSTRCREAIDGNMSLEIGHISVNVSLMAISNSHQYT